MTFILEIIEQMIQSRILLLQRCQALSLPPSYPTYKLPSKVLAGIFCVAAKGLAAPCVTIFQHNGGDDQYPAPFYYCYLF